MNRRGLSQEGLKLIACATMLVDHIGASMVPNIWLRVVGRIAFPIYCFLLAEGVYRTRDPKKYGLRLAIGLLLSEIPFELLFYGRLNGQHTSVMVTLLIGFLYGIAQKELQNLWQRVLLVLPFAFAARLLHTDYGSNGILMIAIFLLTRQMKCAPLWQTMLLAVLCWFMNSYRMPLMGLRIPIEIFAVIAMVPIALYSGRKRTHNPVIQWGFYLFYPVHLTVLLLIERLLLA